VCQATILLKNKVLNLRSARTLLVTTLRLPEQRRGMEREGEEKGRSKRNGARRRGGTCKSRP